MSLCCVTALYDIGRREADGRSLDWYERHLTSTLGMFHETLVLHDGSLSSYTAPEGCRLHLIPRESLPPFRLKDRVSELQGSWHPIAPNDITQTVPEYALVQFAKFWMLVEAARETRADYYMWVDAAISRFIEEHNAFNMDDLEQEVVHLLGGGDALFEVDLRRNVTLAGRLRRPEVGSSRRVLSGGAFVVRAGAIRKYASETLEIAEKWLAEGIWDNEQVALTHLLLNGSIRPSLLWSASPQPGAVARLLGKREARVSFGPDTLVSRVLTR